MVPSMVSSIVIVYNITREGIVVSQVAPRQSLVTRVDARL